MTKKRGSQRREESNIILKACKCLYKYVLVLALNLETVHLVHS